jgi:hypothetical protein
MADGSDDDQNDPIDDELDDAMMVAAELVARAKQMGLDKLELPVNDESSVWTVTVKKAGIREHLLPSSDGDGANAGQNDGTMP